MKTDILQLMSKTVLARFTRKLLCFLMTVFLFITQALSTTCAQTAFLPTPVSPAANLSQVFDPVLIKGLKIFADNPLRFDFILDTGDTNLNSSQLTAETATLIKYFLASLTVPESDLWVNLAPHEQDRIIPKDFGSTDMGQKLLSQDSLLKNISASLTDPQTKSGRKYWQEVQQALTGTKDHEFPISDPKSETRVWIVPQKAVVYENKNIVYIVESRLKVMMQEDYTALPQEPGTGRLGLGAGNWEQKTANSTYQNPEPRTQSPSTEAFRAHILPQIEKQVNESEQFAPLRQIYHALILATWFKQNLKEGILAQLYINKNKIDGVDSEDQSAPQKIYAQYLDAFQKGAYNLIREEEDPVSGDIVPRKYFSGGVGFIGNVPLERSESMPADIQRRTNGRQFVVSSSLISQQPAPEQAAGSPAMTNQYVVRDIFMYLATIGRSATEGQIAGWLGPYLANGVPQEKFTTILAKGKSAPLAADFPIFYAHSFQTARAIEAIRDQKLPEATVTIVGGGMNFNEMSASLELFAQRYENVPDQFPTIHFNFYDINFQVLANLQQTAGEQIQNFKERFPHWAEKVNTANVQYFYFDITDQNSWDMLLKPSNITWVRHTWILAPMSDDQDPMSLSDFEKFIAELKKRISVGAILVEEVTAGHDKYLVQEIINPQASTAISATLDSTPIPGASGVRGRDLLQILDPLDLSTLQPLLTRRNDPSSTSGGTGTLYSDPQAPQSRTGIIYKVANDPLNFPGAEQSLENEARALITLNNRGVQKIPLLLGYGRTTEGRLFLKLQSAAGAIDFHSLLKEWAENLSPDSEVQTFIDIAQILKEIHRAGYVHGDIKTNNIITQITYNDDQGIHSPFTEIIDFTESYPIGTRVRLASKDGEIEITLTPRHDIKKLGIMFQNIFGEYLPNEEALLMRGMMLDAGLRDLIDDLTQNTAPRDIQEVIDRLKQIQDTLRQQMPQEATSTSITKEKPLAPGGIDLSPDNWTLEKHGEGIDFNTPLDPVILKHLEIMPFTGFSPVILRIVPVTNLQFFLGAQGPGNNTQLSAVMD